MSDALPAALPPVPLLRAGPGTVEVTRAVRLAASLTSDVRAELAGAGEPAAGAGDGDAAADAERRAVVGASDVAQAALQRGARALERFEDRVGDLLARREAIADAADLFAAEVGRARLLPEGPDRRAAAAVLRRWRATLADDVADLLAAERAAEDAVVRALGALDGRAEAQRAASAPRPDVERLARQLRERLGRPDAVRAWWERLGAAAREALVVAEPDLVVGAGGVAAADRDDAGRAALARDLWGSAGRTREGLAALTSALGAGGLLLGYRPGGDGRAVVSHGDPDTAGRTVVVVPGFGTDLPGIDGLVSHADDLLDEADARGRGGTAVVTWVGYDAPDFHPDGVRDLLAAAADAAGVVGQDRAAEGADALDGFVDGLRASDAGDASRVTVVGHSYGSTTTAIAAAGGLDADAVVLLGSPGAGAGNTDVADLGPVGGAGEVYVGSRDHDPVTWLGHDGPLGLGPDPAQASFGAERIDVGDGAPFHLDGLGPVGLGENHSGYLDPGSDSLDQVVDVVTGEAPDVVPGRDDPAAGLVADWAGEEGRHQLGEGMEWLRDRLG